MFRSKLMDNSQFDDNYRRSDEVAKPNFQFEKRQKELAKKKKNEEKLKRKLDKNSATTQVEPKSDQPDSEPKAPSET